MISELESNFGLLSDIELVRRNSMSMGDIPPGSLAAGLLGQRKKSVISDIKDISKKFSDFESCQSAMSSSSSDDSTDDHSETSNFRTMNSRKREKKERKKRKASLTPRKEEFLKKQNKSGSPSEKI